MAVGPELNGAEGAIQPDPRCVSLPEGLKRRNKILISIHLYIEAFMLVNGPDGVQHARIGFEAGMTGGLQLSPDLEQINWGCDHPGGDARHRTGIQSLHHVNTIIHKDDSRSTLKLLSVSLVME